MENTQIEQLKTGKYRRRLETLAREIELIPLVREACDFGCQQSTLLKRNLVNEHDARIAIRAHVRIANDKHSLSMADRVRLSTVAFFAAGISE